jgi:hypothetical protein
VKRLRTRGRGGGASNVSIALGNASFTPAADQDGLTLPISPASADGLIVVLPRNRSVGYSITIKRVGANPIEIVAGKGATATYTQIAAAGTVTATVSTNVGGKAAVWSVTGNTATATDADAEALFTRIAAATTPYTDERKVYAARFIKKLKADGIWSKLDALYMLAAPTEAGALLNWKSSSFNLTKTGTVAFTADRFATGDGSTGYLEASFNPATAGGQFALDSCHLGVFASGPDSSSTAFEVGNTQARLAVRSGADIGWRLNDATNSATPVPDLPPVSAIGHTIVTRRSSTDKRAAKDGAASTGVSVASTGITSANFRLLGNIAASYSTRRVAAVHWGAALSDAEIAAFTAALQRYLKQIGAFTEPNVRGVDTTNLIGATFSTDTATYGAMSSQQIPSITIAGGYVYRANYGIRAAPAGTNGELSGSYVRVSRTPVSGFSSGATWEHVAFFLPTDTNYATSTDAVGLGAVECLPDGRLLLQFYYQGGVGGLQTVWATILDNPDAIAASLSWGPQTFMGYKWSGRPRLHNGELRGSIPFENLGGSGSGKAWEGDKYGRFVAFGSIPYFELISVAPWPVPDTLTDYFESHYVQVGSNGVLRTFRTSGAIHTSTSFDDGLTWTTPIAISAFPTTSSWAELARGPDGRLGFLHNRSVERANMTLALSAVYASALNFVATCNLDSRGAINPRVSYGSVAYDPITPDTIWCAWDCGRGKQDSPTFTNELIVARVSVADILANGDAATVVKSIVTT